jgi:hypothetical protein
MPQVNTPTSTITENTAARNYTIALACALEGATLTYTIDGASTTYDGEFIVEGGKTITVVASKTNYTDSKTLTITTAEFSQDATKTQTSSGGSANVDLVFKSFTIAGTYVAGNSNTTKTKIRAFKAVDGIDGYAFRISVNDGYIITKVVAEGTSNKNTVENVDYTGAISVTDVLVDGTSVGVTGSFAEYGQTATSITVDNIEAKNSIDFAWTPSENIIQALITFTITYKLADQPEFVKTVTFNNDIPFATLYVDKNVAVPSGVTVYTGALSESGNYFNLTQVTTGVIPANTGVILEGTAGATADFYTTSHTEIAAVTSVLSGSTEEVTVSDVYVLSYNEGKEDVGFYKFSGTLPANKAYLEVSSNAPAFRFNFGEETDEPGNVTGINAVTIENRTQNVIYDLRGRRVLNLDRPGLYIVNGKKVAIQ